MPSLFSPTQCGCGRRSSCPWFVGDPGPQETAYKSDIFQATAGNYLHDPAKLAALREVVVSVLGYSDLPAHYFGDCGRQWTLAALQYRLRDGAMASSFAILLLPRPVPATLLPFVQKIARSDRPYRPSTHRFDVNPFAGFSTRRSAQAKLNLSHVEKAVWSSHASWLARACMGIEVDWACWRFTQVARTPAQLLGDTELPTMRVNNQWSGSNRLSAPNLRLSMIKDLPQCPYDDADADTDGAPALVPLAACPPTYWIVHNRDPSPTLPAFTSRQSSFKGPEGRMYHPRPQSFAAFSRRSASPPTPVAISHDLPLPLPTYRSTTSLSYTRIPGQWSVLTSSSSASSAVGLGLGLETAEPKAGAYPLASSTADKAAASKYPPTPAQYPPTWR